MEESPTPTYHHVEQPPTPPHVEHPLALARILGTCDCSQHLQYLEAILDWYDEYLDQMQSSFTVELSTMKELLMVLVKGKTTESQQCYGSGECQLFYAPEVDNGVDDVFMNVFCFEH
ncbi:uncharacterized protein E5676_scaffold447G00620 [Cucumis melo var. makuwa]|nr:uncharacterized protein E5676_scaffold447G00620 [Cucumis melo var. makuwa]